ncbi:MAG: L-threonylcarbamoyladenylate synthase [Bacilli bacterium]
MEKVTVKELLLMDITNKVVCFPTDTVYGVGARIIDLDAIDRIFALKKRNDGKPLAILCPSKDITAYVDDITPDIIQLMKEGWPGALTLIFKKSRLIDDAITKGLSTVAFRMPDSVVALAILKQFGLMATTSVNISGEVEMNDVDLIYERFYHEIDYIVTDCVSLSKKPSKIIDVSIIPPCIIRG